MRNLADRLLRAPTVELLGSAVPVADHVVLVAHEHRVVRHRQEIGLLAQHRLSGLVSLHQQRGDADGGNGDDAAGKGRCLVLGAVRDGEREQRQRHAADTDGQKLAVVTEIGGDEDHQDIEHRHRHSEGREGVDGKNRDREQYGRGR